MGERAVLMALEAPAFPNGLYKQTIPPSPFGPTLEVPISTYTCRCTVTQLRSYCTVTKLPGVALEVPISTWGCA